MFAFLFMLCVPDTTICETKIIESKTEARCEALRTDFQKKYAGQKGLLISRCLPIDYE